METFQKLEIFKISLSKVRYALPGPCTAFTQVLSFNSFRKRIDRDERQREA